MMNMPVPSVSSIFILEDMLPVWTFGRILELLESKIESYTLKVTFYFLSVSVSMIVHQSIYNKL